MAGAEETIVEFAGHPAVTALHTRTFEVTMEESLGPRGDCIIGVAATRACADLPGPLKRLLRTPGVRVTLRIEVGPETIACRAEGDPTLPLRSSRDIVVRKSNFVCPRTLAVRATLAAADLPRHMVLCLRNPHARGRLVVRAQSG